MWKPGTEWKPGPKAIKRVVEAILHLMEEYNWTLLTEDQKVWIVKPDGTRYQLPPEIWEYMYEHDLIGPANLH